MKTIIVLISVDYHNARKLCEYIEDQQIEDFENSVEFAEINQIQIEEKRELYITYPLTDFMDACNNEEINLNNWFISYVYCNN